MLNLRSRLLRTLALFAGPATYLLITASLPAAAQTTQVTGAAKGNALEEVVVTAERRSTNVQKTPISITTIAGASIQAKAQTNVADVLQGVPALVVQASANGFAVAIRGVGFDISNNIGSPSVALNYDGVFSDALDGSLIGFYDINRVEVLRGPQGTLYGRNAEAGVINIITNDPVLGKNGGSFGIGIGNYGLLSGTGAANVALGSNVAARFAFNYSNHSGYLSNGQDDDDEKSVRAKLLYQYSENTKFLITGEYDRDGGKGSGTVPGFTSKQPSSPWTTNSAPDDVYNFDQWKLFGRADVDFGYGIATVIPSTQTLRDYNFTNLGFFLIQYGSRERQDSVEARVANEPDSPFKWTAGLYYFDKNDPDTTVLPSLQYNLSQANSKAVFGEVTIPLQSWLRATAGVRETRDVILTSLDQEVGPGVFSKASLSDTFNDFDSKLELEADVAPQSLVYAERATGYRPGGLYALAPGDVFGAEHVDSYEVGSKNRFLDNRLQVDGDVYYFDYHNYQAGAVIFIGVIPTDTVTNAPGATAYGVETDTTYRVTPDDLVKLDLTYMHGTFEHGFVVGGTNYSGEVLPHTPKFMVGLDLQHTVELGDYGDLTGEFNLSYQTSNYLTYQQDAYSRQSAYALENASLLYQFPSGNSSLSLWSKNLSNQAIKTQLITAGPTTNINVNAPRTFGATYLMKF